MALFSHSMASSMALFSLSLSSSATLPSNLEFSRLFLASIFLRWSSSSDLYFSASATLRSISSLDRRPLSLVMVILFFWPVLLSSAETLRMELASMSEITLSWGTPRGAGGIPESSNLPRRLLSLVRARSPQRAPDQRDLRHRRQLHPQRLRRGQEHRPEEQDHHHQRQEPRPEEQDHHHQRQ